MNRYGIRIFLGLCPLSTVEVMSPAFRRIARSPSSGKNIGGSVLLVSCLQTKRELASRLERSAPLYSRQRHCSGNSILTARHRSIVTGIKTYTQYMNNSFQSCIGFLKLFYSSDEAHANFMLTFQTVN
jgi:hypothetical protein